MRSPREEEIRDAAVEAARNGLAYRNAARASELDPTNLELVYERIRTGCNWEDALDAFDRLDAEGGEKDA